MSLFLIVLPTLVILSEAKNLKVKHPELLDRAILHKPSCPISTPIRFDSTYPYDVLHYNINIELDFPGNLILHAWTEITAKSKTDTLSRANFNFVGLTIDSVLANGSIADYEQVGTGPDQILSVDLAGTIPDGDIFRIGVSYSGRPTDGIYYQSGIAYVMSIPWSWTNYPIGARYWFPCKDEFHDKATSELSVTVPAGYKVVANGYLENVDTVSTKVTYHWVENYPIPTWYIVFAVSDYVVLNDTFVYGDSSMPIIHFVRRADSSDALIAFSNVSDILTFFSDLFSEGSCGEGRYPFFHEKYGLVQLPSLGWAMENQTNVFLAISIPPNHNYEWLIAHETAHQWWGCSITPGSVKDVWLNEGFATYCEALHSDYWEGGIPYHDYMIDIMDYYLNYENSPLGHPFPIYDPPGSGLWSATTYEKGAAVLHMLRHIVGDSTFFDILCTYYKTYEYSNAITADFQTVAETQAGIELDWFFDEWIYKAGHPEYEWSWGWDSLGQDSFRINLYINQVQPHNWDVPTFKMPIDIEVYSAYGDTTLFVAWDSLETQSFSFLVNYPPTSVKFDPNDWILKEATFVGVEEQAHHDKNEMPLRVTAKQSPTLVKDYFEISYKLDKPGYVSFAVYNLAGARVGRIERYHPLKGKYILKQNINNLPTGIYFYNLSIDNKLQTKGKFIVIK
ncbi:MAG: M1 family aminopeptidase [bacterium]|nr:M1 family aminopeptidase [bacterium]